MPDLKEFFFSTLNKSSYLTKRDINALWAVISTLIGSFRFSLNKVSQLFGRKVGRNYLSKVLKKYAYIQESLLNQFIEDMVQELGKNTKYYVITDDTLLAKAGKHIFRSFKWYDHTTGRQINAMCLVTLSIVVDNHVVFMMPWLLKKPTKNSKGNHGNKKEQDLKTKSSIEMIQFIVDCMLNLGVSKKKIYVEADSWFSSFTMRNFLTELGINYRLDGRSNYTVQVPDHEAIKLAKTQIRGRKRSRFVKYVQIQNFVGDPSTWRRYYNKDKDIHIAYKQVEVTLKSGGKSLIYAYWHGSWTKIRFIMTQVIRKGKSTAKTIFQDYCYRWWIEVAHQELKQQFGINKSKNRDPWVVTGFIGLVSFSYSLFKFKAFCFTKATGQSLPCPTWSEKFNIEITKSFGCQSTN
ncbi:MAG: transposase [Candidatus Heimdallarchaeota archaeon]